MNTAATFAAKTASVANSSVASATASSSAQAGTHSLTVTSLAQSQTLVSESSTNSGYASDTAQNFGTGTITIANAADPQNPVTVNIDNTNNSLQGIAAAINASGANVTASVVNDGSGTPYRLAIIGKDTGTYSVTASLTGGTYDAPTFAEKVECEPGGLPTGRHRHDPDHQYDNGCDTRCYPEPAGDDGNSSGSTGNSSATTITIGNDTAGVTTEINNFVSSYNNVMNLINTDTAYDSTTNTAGVLFGDSTIRTVLNSLQTVLTNQVSGATGSFSSLAEIGITSDKDTGLLSVDSSDIVQRSQYGF